MSLFISEAEIKTIKAFSSIWQESYDYWEWHKQYEFAEGESDGNDPSEYLTLSEEQQSILRDWIDYALEQDENYISPDSSYGLKHIFERDEGGFYITNGQLKGAMIHYGFDPVNPREINCYYRVRLRKELLDK